MQHDNGKASSFHLMRKNAIAATFSWNPSNGKVSRSAQVVDRDNLPFGCLDNMGTFQRTRLESWLANRAIPSLRPNARKRLSEVGIASESELLALGYGLGLSDQYWIKPIESDAAWEDVNYFDNAFSPELGELLVAHDPDSIPNLVNALKETPSLLGRSPDVALNGNLPKHWKIEGDARMLIKYGRPDSRFQEPFNEAIVSRLCSRLFDGSDYVPYTLRNDGYLRYSSACPCMVDADTEFVPAIQLHDSHRRNNDEDLGSFYIRICRENGIDVAIDVEKMIVVDYISANFDRHWNNFGVLMDSDSREFVSAAPIFDTGESFWCNREFNGNAFTGYEMKEPGTYRPFMRNLDAQLSRYCFDLSWFDPDSLVGFGDEMEEILSGNPIVSNEPGRIEAIRNAVEKRIHEVSRQKTIRRRIVGTGNPISISTINPLTHSPQSPS